MRALISKQTIQTWTGYTAVFIIYLVLFGSSFLLTERIIDGSQVNADVQKTSTVCSEY